jgi:hypothetical protein
LTATVENPLDRDLDAALTFHTVTPPATGRFGVSKAFNLPRQSALRVSFPVYSPLHESSHRQMSYGILELKVDGAVIDERRAEITFLDDNVYAIAVLGEANGLAEALAARSLYPNRGPELQSMGVVRSLALSDAQVPEDPRGLDFLHTLIVIHPSTHELRPGQWAAVDEWVQGGGNVVFVLGSDTAAHEVPDIRPMLAAHSTGTRRVTVIPTLGEWSGEALRFDDGVVLSEMVATSGRVLARDGGVPLVVQSQRGSGRVSCVALNVEQGLADIPAYRQFWLEVLRHLHQPRVIDTQRIEPFIDSTVEQFAGRQVVGIWLPVMIIAAYLVIVFLFLRKLQGQRVTEARWVGVCAAAIVFAGASHTLLWAMAPTPAREVFDIWVATGTSPSQTLQLADYLSILPASRGDTTLHINNRRIQVVPTHETGATVVDSAVHYQRASVTFQAEKSRLRTLHLKGQLAVPGLVARAKPGPESVSVELDNQSAYDLANCFFKLGRLVQPVGPLAQRERKTISIAPATRPADSYESNQIIDSSARMRNSILGALFVDPATQSDEELLTKEYRGPEQGTSSGSILAGWVDQSLLDVSWNDAEGTPARALGLIAIEPEWEPGESRFLVPRGGMSLRLPELGARQYYFGKSAFRGDHAVPSSLVIEFAVPPWAQPAQIEQATLYIQFTSEAYRLDVRLGDERLSLPDVPSGRFPLPAPTAALPAAGPIKLHLVVQPRDEFANELSRQGYRWALREIELECRCRRLLEDHD